MAKFFAFGVAIIGAAMLADVLTHGTQAEQAANGIAQIWTPSLQAASGQTISKPSA